MEEFVDTRSRNAVIKRMLELGLIGDRSEILPSKRKKSQKSRPISRSDNESGSDDGDSDDSDAVDTRKVKVTVKNVRSKASANGKAASKTEAPRKSAKASLNVASVRRMADELDGDAKEHLEWIQESLIDAAEDADEVDDDADANDGKFEFTWDKYDIRTKIHLLFVSIL